MPQPEAMKSVTVRLSLDEWKALRHAAARRRVSLTELARQWIAEQLTRLKSSPESETDDDSET